MDAGLIKYLATLYRVADGVAIFLVRSCTPGPFVGTEQELVALARGALCVDGIPWREQWQHGWEVDCKLQPLQPDQRLAMLMSRRAEVRPLDPAEWNGLRTQLRWDASRIWREAISVSLRSANPALRGALELAASQELSELNALDKPWANHPWAENLDSLPPDEPAWGVLIRRVDLPLRIVLDPEHIEWLQRRWWPIW